MRKEIGYLNLSDERKNNRRKKMDNPTIKNMIIHNILVENKKIRDEVTSSIGKNKIKLGTLFTLLDKLEKEVWKNEE